MASTECNIISFELNGVYGVISGTAIAVTFPTGTAVTSLVPRVMISKGATIAPLTAQNFTNPVTYTVTAEDGTTTKTYTVTVTVDPTGKKVSEVSNAGWMGTKVATGDFDTYTAGGIKLDLGSFKPIMVVGIQVDKGYSAYYDLSTQKLTAYTSAGTEFTNAVNIRYSVVLMGIQ